MQIYIESGDGRITLEVDGSDTIEQVRQKMQDKGYGVGPRQRAFQSELELLSADAGDEKFDVTVYVRPLNGGSEERIDFEGVPYWSLSFWELADALQNYGAFRLSILIDH
jgi:hypothetical protein